VYIAIEKGTFDEGLTNCASSHYAEMFDAYTPAEEYYMR
jgi:hypothetical protein